MNQQVSQHCIYAYLDLYPAGRYYGIIKLTLQKQTGRWGGGGGGGVGGGGVDKTVYKENL